MGSYLTALDARKNDLEQRYPGWQVWYVPRQDRTVTWCARPKPGLEAATPDDLAEEIERVDAQRRSRCARGT